MQNEKKIEYSPIVVIMVIILLSVLIAAPPYFRFMFPKENKEENVVTNTTTILTCTKEVDNLKVVSKTLYKNKEKERNTINFFTVTDNPTNKIDPKTTPNAEEQSPESEKEFGRTIEEEMSFLSAIENIKKTENETVTTFIIDLKLINDNNKNLELANYLSSLETQNEFYNNLGYTCTSQEI